MSDIFAGLIRRIEYLERTLNQVDRRTNNMMREARVTEIFPEEGMVKVDAHGVVSKKVPWLQRAGSIRDWNPPSKDERVILLSPTGEPGRGLILPGGYSDKFPQPHNASAEKVTVIGEVSVKQTGSSFVINAGGVTVTISGAGVVIEGGEVRHDDLNIGSTHRHRDVEPGSGTSGIPLP